MLKIQQSCIKAIKRFVIFRPNFTENQFRRAAKSEIWRVIILSVNTKLELQLCSQEELKMNGQITLQCQSVLAVLENNSMFNRDVRVHFCFYRHFCKLANFAFAALSGSFLCRFLTEKMFPPEKTNL